MSARRIATNAAERYDQALLYAHDRRLPAGAPRPQPTCHWPPENVACLERFAGWVVSSGTSQAITRQLYIPMAGHVLGLALKPWQLLDLDADLEPAMDYVKAKGLRDRTVFLTDTTVRVLSAYLAVRGQGPDSHVFLYRNEPIKKDLLQSRIKSAGERVGVKVHPHKLRHTAATQLLNAGCRITSIQKLLGHKRLNSTMTYARVHDQTAADDYYAAMAHIEARLQLAPPTAALGQSVAAGERAQLLELTTCLAAPELSVEARLGLVERMRLLLLGGAPGSAPFVTVGGASQRDPPAAFAPLEANQVMVGRRNTAVWLPAALQAVSFGAPIDGRRRP